MNFAIWDYTEKIPGKYKWHLHVCMTITSNDDKVTARELSYMLYHMKYTHGSVLLCFYVVIWSDHGGLHEIFTRFIQGYFTHTVVITLLT